MENDNSENNTSQPITLSDFDKYYIHQTAKWTRLLSIMGFVGIGFLILFAIGMTAIGGLNTGNTAIALPTGMLAGIYFLLAGVYFFPVFYLYKSSINMQEGVLNNNQERLTEGFKFLHFHFKFLGIMTITVISLYILLIIGAMLFTFMR